MAAGFLTSALAELMRAVLRDRAARGPEPLLTVGSIEPGPRGCCRNKRGGECRAGQSRAAPSPLNMIPRTRVFWASLVVVGVLVAESHCIQKTTLSKNWGPQSMLYLKGKYGRRFVPDGDEAVSNSGLRRWFTVIKEFQKLKAMAAGRPTRFFTAENLLIRYTE